jgi:hypothetical protein
MLIGDPEAAVWSAVVRLEDGVECDGQIGEVAVVVRPSST